MLNDVSGVKKIFNGEVYCGEQISVPMNLASCCSEQMDVPESIDVIMNVTPSVMIVSVDGSVMVWAGIHHRGRTALVRVNRALNAQIHRGEISNMLHL